MWAKDVGQGRHFGDGQGKQGSLYHCREYGAERRHQSQNSLLGFRKISSVLQSGLAGQNCSLSCSAHAAARAEGLLEQHQKNCELPQCAHPLLLRVTSKPNACPRSPWPRAEKEATTPEWAAQARENFSSQLTAIGITLCPCPGDTDGKVPRMQWQIPSEVLLE